MNSLPETVSDSERLGRGIFDSRKAKKAASGTVVPGIFRERDGVREISVDRLSFGNHQALADLHSSERSGQGFHGWAELLKSEAATEGRTVVASPIIPANMFHAEIVLPGDLKGDFDDDQNAHALALAMKATWLAKP